MFVSSKSTGGATSWSVEALKLRGAKSVNAAAAAPAPAGLLVMLVPLMRFTM